LNIVIKGGCDDMKIWVIGREYPSAFNNMRGSFELEQAKTLSKNHQVIYPCVDLRSIRHWRKWGISKQLDGNVVLYKYNFPVGKCPRQLLRRIEKRKLEELFDRIIELDGKPDLVHVHYPAMAYYELFVKLKKKGIKIVATEHWTNVLTKDLENTYLNSLNWFVENADAFICVGDALKKSVIDLTETKRKIDVVPNVVSDLFLNAESIRADSSDFVFIATGRLVKVKQFDALISAFTDAFSGKKNIKLQIVGGGEEYDFLLKQISTLAMQNQISLLGMKKRDEVAQLVKNSNVLVCSSRLETFGVPVIEAMACGKPVVTTDALGFTFSLNSQNSIVVSKDDRVALEEALKKVYAEYKKYDSDKIRKTAEEWFSEKAILRRLEEIYERFALYQ
jgi:glycosyltransferase involved in cell wall biosynthesis